MHEKAEADVAALRSRHIECEAAYDKANEAVVTLTRDAAAVDARAAQALEAFAQNPSSENAETYRVAKKEREAAEERVEVARTTMRASRAVLRDVTRQFENYSELLTAASNLRKIGVDPVAFLSSGMPATR